MYNAFNVYRRELAPGIVSLTGDRAQGDDSKHWAYSTCIRFFSLQFIVSIVDQACRISRYGSRVGLIEFSESKKTHVEFKFGQLNSKRLVHRGIDRVGYDRGKMSVSCMLSVACETRDI